ncbi:MAG: ABC transporter ATP-binding protein [Candidatus Brocadiae bacterium]|nr:ABC transporter ATP-binding protein [Candidatus Brocadiia bacterium]
MNCLICAKNASYRYESEAILENISFIIEAKDRIALLGKNGSGKSTLIKALNQLITPYKGSIQFYFEEMKKNYPTDMYTIFSYPDEQILMNTVYSEIALGLLQQGKEQKEIEKIIEESLSFFGLLGYIHQNPYCLSTGEKKKLLLATAFSLNPGILVLDEPFSSLDVRSKKELNSYISKLECTQIIATHEYEYITSLCTRAFVLHNHHLFIFEKIQDLLDNPALLSEYELS